MLLFKYDSLYRFNYYPSTKPDIFDNNPLVFILDYTRKTLLGLNIHWVDKKYQKELVEEFYKIVEKTKLPSQKRQRLHLTYLLLKKPKFRKALQGIRRYRIDHIYNIEFIPSKDWKTILNKKEYLPRILKLNVK